VSALIQQKVRILAKEELAAEVFLMQVHCPQVVSMGQPGQFLHLRVGEDPDPLLRRPLSIFRTDPEKGVVSLLFRVVGRGTRLMSRMRVGETIDLIGPLGRGFSAAQATRTALVVAGGLGVAPLFFLTENLIRKGVCVHFLLGAQSKKQLLCCTMLRSLGAGLLISTDDGSAGFHGLITQLLEELLVKENFDHSCTMIFSTGPEAMMAGVALLARRFSIPAQFSLERRMACGVGACLGCVVLCRTRSGGREYRRVCADGPVFDLEEVVF
jgi:dihydroorotate dehydrogenase electron transfer subunit